MILDKLHQSHRGIEKTQAKGGTNSFLATNQRRHRKVGIKVFSLSRTKKW